MKRQRLILDIAMSILLVLQMLYLLIGETYHEWVGILLIILFTIHNAINRKWYKAIPKGKYRRKRIVHTAVNAICIISCFLLLISGLSMARHSLPIPIIPMGAARIIHMLASYWGFIAISMHAGFHMAPLVRKAGGNLAGKIIILIMMAGGLYSFIRERIPYYLFFIDEFVFFDFSTPLLVLIIEYVLIMYLFMMAGVFSTCLNHLTNNKALPA